MRILDELAKNLCKYFRRDFLGTTRIPVIPTYINGGIVYEG